MKCRLCGGEIKNEKLLPQHFGLEELDPGLKDNPGPCPRLPIPGIGKPHHPDSLKPHPSPDSDRPLNRSLDLDELFGKLHSIAKNKHDLESLIEAARDFGVKGGSTNTMISRAIQTGMVDETLHILNLGKLTTPRVDPQAVISLLGSIQSQQTIKNSGKPGAEGAASEGFIEEYKEAARRLRKGYALQISPQAAKEAKKFLDERFQTTYRERFGDGACDGINAILKLLERPEAVKAGDMLGGDILDFSKRKCIQLKAVTSPSERKLCERLREAGTQLQAAAAEGKEKREIPPPGFRRVADIRIQCAGNPINEWDREYLRVRVNSMLQGSDDFLKAKPKPGEEEKKPADLRDSVDIVRITSGAGKVTFRRKPGSEEFI